MVPVNLRYLSANARGIKPVALGFVAIIVFYILGTMLTKTQVRSIDIEYVDRSTYAMDLHTRLAWLEKKVQNISADVGTLMAQVFATVPPPSPPPTTGFWMPLDEADSVDSDDSFLTFNTTNHTTTLVTTSRCQHKLKLLILISSEVSHLMQRQTIRATWGSDPSLFQPRWKTVFLVGRSHNKTEMRRAIQEAEHFGDLVIGDFYEDFFNLSFKVEMGFEWADRYCDFDYLLKGDDDVFVNIPRLFAFLDDAETPKKELYAGNVHYQAFVFRKGRYFVTKEEYTKKFYPRYCSGGGFVLSRDVLRRMVPHFNLVDPLKIDDAYVGELALKAGVDVLHEDNFKMFQKKDCKYEAKVIVHHPVPSRECMELLYKQTLVNVER